MKILSVVGARPQFIKASPLSRAIRLHHHEILLHTGQRYDYGMSDVFFDDLGIPPPDYNLGVGSCPNGAQTGAMLQVIETVLEKERPQGVIVYFPLPISRPGCAASIDRCRKKSTAL